MNINKFIIFILTFVLLNFNYVWSEEKIKLDEEELPAIDPFQGNAAVGQNQNSIDENSNEQNSEAGILNAMIAFVIAVVAWLYMIQVLYSGEGGVAVKQASPAVQTAYKTMMWIIIVGWAVYHSSYSLYI